MDISTILGGSAASSASAASRDQTLGQGQFMTLMLAQFNAQNPLEPMANTEFLGQLAQFSVVSGVQQLDASFQAMAQRLAGDQALQGANLLGKPVQFWTESLRWDGSTPPQFAVDLPEGVSTIEIEVLDASGARVAQWTQATSGDEARLAWDGRGSNGEPVKAGDYAIQVRTVAGKDSEALAVRGGASVAAVMPSSQGLVLELDDGRLMPLANVIQIRVADPA